MIVQFHARLRRCVLLVILSLCGLPVLSGVALAVEVRDLYEATVPVDGRTRPLLDKAMAEAFVVVTSKVSGQAVGQKRLAPLLKRVSDHVRSYSYLGGRGEPLRLQVSFDSVAVDASLQSAGIPVWTSNRPATLVWLAVEEGGKRRIASPDSDPALAGVFRDHVATRGVPVSLPLYDVDDMAALSAGDVWGQFNERIRAASAHYRPDLVVSARLRQVGTGWSGDWTADLPGGPRTTTLSGASLADAVQAGLGWVSDTVVSGYAGGQTGAGVASAGTLRLVVKGVGSARAYAALLDLLSRSVAVKSVFAEQLEGDAVTLSVVPATSTDTLLHGLTSSGALVPDDAGGTADEGVLHLTWKG